MYYTVRCSLYGNCADINYREVVDGSKIIINEDIRDVISYLYEKHFGVPYRELGWWLEPGAKEFVKELEDKWWKNELDVSKIYADEEYLKELATERALFSEEDLEDAQDYFEESLRSELDDLEQDELEDLWNFNITVDYTIEDEEVNVLAVGFVDLPELKEDEEDDE